MYKLECFTDAYRAIYLSAIKEQYGSENMEICLKSLKDPEIFARTVNTSKNKILGHLIFRFICTEKNSTICMLMDLNVLTVNGKDTIEIQDLFDTSMQLLKEEYSIKTIAVSTDLCKYYNLNISNYKKLLNNFILI